MIEIPKNVIFNPNKYPTATSNVFHKYAPPNEALKNKPKFIRVIPAGTLTIVRTPGKMRPNNTNPTPQRTNNDSARSKWHMSTRSQRENRSTRGRPPIRASQYVMISLMVDHAAMSNPIANTNRTGSPTTKAHTSFIQFSI